MSVRNYQKFYLHGAVDMPEIKNIDMIEMLSQICYQNEDIHRSHSHSFEYNFKKRYCERKFEFDANRKYNHEQWGGVRLVPVGVWLGSSNGKVARSVRA